MKINKLLKSLAIAAVLLTQLTDVSYSSPNPKQLNVSNIKQSSKSYIGLRYRDLPKGLQDLGGWVVGDTYANRDYAIARVKKGNQEMLWFEIITGRDAQGQASYQVIDVLNVPKILKNQSLTPFCKLKGVRDPEIIAIAKLEDTEYWTKISQAWRANRKTGKIEVIPTRNISCENTGWGV